MASKSDQEKDDVKKSVGYSITKLRSLFLSHLWKIENCASVLKLLGPGNKLHSEIFEHAEFEDAFWQLSLQPSANNDDELVSLGVSVYMAKHSAEPFRAEYAIAFVDDKKNLKQIKRGIGEFKSVAVCGGRPLQSDAILVPENDGDPTCVQLIFAYKQLLNFVRSDGSLLISFKVEFIPTRSKTEKQALGLVMSSAKPRNAFASRPDILDSVEIPRSCFESYDKLLAKGAFSDCVVRVSGVEIPAHKCILVTQSSVFATLFYHESLGNSIEISGVGEKAVRTMLRFIYTGSLEGFSDVAQELLILSEKYTLTDLKQQCERHLTGCINMENACKLLVLADQCQAKLLRSSCMAFIANYKQQLLKSDAWNQLKESKPKLVFDVLEYLV